MTLSPEMVAELIKKARRDRADDDLVDEDDFFNPQDHFGGNYDDAYYGGCRDGETVMARRVLNELGIAWHE